MEFSLGMPATGEPTTDKLFDVIVIGSGPAGLTAALYAARAHLDVLVLTGSEIGGQVALTTEVENYPGFPEGIQGPELVQRMQEQAERFGARVELDTITAVDFQRHPFVLTGYNGNYLARAVIVATGASPRKLQVPGEAELTGRGVSYCATCDGWFFQDKEVVVVGGGDSAMEEGLFLTKFARKVTVVHRRDQLRASKILQKRAFANPKMDFIWDTVVTEILGEEKVEAVRLKNVKTGEELVMPIDGVFIFIGHIPNTSIFQGQLEIDEGGYLVVDRRMHTSVPGVFAAGEVADPIFRQVITSAGMGAAAAMEAEKWLAERKAEQEEQERERAVTA
ncbi:MAG: thioredoxin-disulfide reductase [Chloroflexi bacterium]|nr:MAG: thioredoxin-disulfide reductase [Chloroflexota bacterium]